MPIYSIQRGNEQYVNTQKTETVGLSVSALG